MVRRPARILAAYLALALSACGGLVPEGRSGHRPATPPRPVAVSPQAQRCLADLGTTGARFTPQPDRFYGAGCSMLGTVKLSGLQGDDRPFTLTGLGPVACPLAETFAAWARFGVDRAARQELGSPLARIETLGSYSCRTIAGSGRMSTHATAQAIDVAAFVLADGQRISVIGNWRDGSDRERAFLRLVHKSACKRFGTVLGPEYNAAHRDHLHLEDGRRGGLCR